MITLIETASDAVLLILIAAVFAIGGGVALLFGGWSVAILLGTIALSYAVGALIAMWWKP